MGIPVAPLMVSVSRWTTSRPSTLPDRIRLLGTDNAFRPAGLIEFVCNIRQTASTEHTPSRISGWVAAQYEPEEPVTVRLGQTTGRQASEHCYCTC